MKFSVVIPTRDRPNWLERAVHSVVSQAYDDWELVVYDNGERSSIHALGEYMDDERIVYSHGHAAGPADAFNKAVGLATGDIVTPLGDDDRLAPGALGLASWFPPDDKWMVGLTSYQDAEGNHLLTLGGEWDEERYRRQYYLGGAVYFRPEIFAEQGGYSSEFDGAADYDLYWRFAKAYGPPAFLDEVLYLYTDHPDTDTNRRHAEQQRKSAAIVGRHT